MGQSTNGILVFGFEVGDEEEAPDYMKGFEGFEDYLDSLSGLPAYGEPGHSFDDQQVFRAKCPADLVTHCSLDYPMYILAVRGTKTSARRGYPAEISPDELNVPIEKINALKAWAAERGIEGEPKWLLCSLWA